MARIPVDKVLKKAAVFAQKGEIEQARNHYNIILDKFPQNRRAKQGLEDLASLASKKIEKLADNQALFNIQLDRLKNLYVRGDLNKAFDYGQNLARQFPEEFMMWNVLGLVNLRLQRLNDALSAFRKAIKLNPGFSEGFNNLGATLQEQGNVEEAIAAHRHSLQLSSENSEAYHNLGRALNKAGQPEGAIQAYRNALALNPNDINSYFNLGTIYQNLGRTSEAIETFKGALKAEPDHAAAHLNLSALIQYEIGHPHIEQVRTLLNRSEQDNKAKFYLHFALAKMQEDLGKEKEALESYKAGGAIRQALSSYDFSQDQELFSKIRNAAPHIKKHAPVAQNQRIPVTPIFILGMPRSGTTLVEQILSSHSQINGAGELDLLEKLGWDINIGKKKANINNVKQVRKLYLEALAKLSKKHPFVTDKMPHNFRQISLICSALPEAKIIHMKRDAAATCWSNFKTFFASDGLGYSYNLKSVVKYYELYKELMAYWEQLYPNRIYELNYDQLVVDQENETRKLISHIGIDWEEDCLYPHKNERAIHTASSEQVRQKIYKGSSNAWRKFKPFLDGAFDELQGL